MAAPISDSMARPSARHQLKLQDHGHMASVSYGVPVYLTLVQNLAA